MDSNQDLMILGENGAPRLGSISFHLRSTETGKPHPLARTSTICVDLESPILDSIRITYQETMGQYFMAGIYIENIGRCVHEIPLWDWRSGKLVMRVRSEQEVFPVFLDEHHIIIYSLVPRGDLRSQHPALFIYRIPKTPQGHDLPLDATYYLSRYPVQNPTLILELPELNSSATVDRDSLAMGTQPLPGDVALSKTATFAFTRAIIIELSFGVRESSTDEHSLDRWELGHWSHYQVFVHTSHLHAQLKECHHQPESTATKYVSWARWGPAATRWFQTSLAESGMGGLCGSRYVGVNASTLQPSVTLSLYDFDVPVFKKYVGIEESAHGTGVTERPAPVGQQMSDCEVRMLGSETETVMSGD
ncbi:unnamed protein product [Rhizoctonia solani]|uniref:Uncharacterized protein n=1 Tax=Rhizoctonia solani TaxID=456999 RepID=A0A8H3B7P0_9AGAM|nr:unnamed protein product [Rhizoctonia solani]